MSNTEHEVHSPDGSVQHPDAAYERRDVNFGCILALIIVTACSFVVMFALDWYFFRAERQIQAESKSSPYARSSAAPPSSPPQPRLEQVNRLGRAADTGYGYGGAPPLENYRDRVAEMVRQLHSSGPAAEKGFVHIPIEQAMKDIVKQLPVRKQPSDEALHPVYSGSSNSGHMLPGAPPWAEY
jgi:hypothetical protein